MYLIRINGKSTAEITRPLAMIRDSMEIAEAVLGWTIVIIISQRIAASFLESGVNYGIVQVIQLIVIGLGILLFLLFLSALIIRRIERDYLIKLTKEGKLPLLTIRIWLKGRSETITGKLLLMGISSILIEESDRCTVNLDYNRIAIVGVFSHNK